MSGMGGKLSRREVLRRLLLAGIGAPVATACAKQAPTAGPAPTQAAVSAATAAATATPPDTAVPADPTATAAQTGSTAVESPPQAAPKPPAVPPGGNAYLAAARGDDPAAITELAVKALGGMERFVKSGADVIIKPNICTDYYSYEYAATTNPQVVAALVRLALAAGASRVRVMDFPFGGSAESAYAKSGIAEAVKAAGGEMELMNSNKFRMTPIPEGKSIQEWEIYQEVLKCDLLINVPIAKHHSLARLTLGGKNLLGVIQRRSSIHAQMGPRIADLISAVRPGLTVVDAVRTLMAHGPTGGSLDDVKLSNTVIASHDIVAADAYAAGLFGMTGEDISYVKAAAERGLGTLDLKSIKVEELAL